MHSPLPVRRLTRSVFGLIWLVCGLLATAQAADTADRKEKTAAEMLPPSAAAYGEIQPAQLIKLVMDHKITKRVLEIPEVKRGFETDKFQEFSTVLSAVEGKIGMKWREAAEALTAGGVFIAVDVPTQGVALFAKARDSECLAKLHDNFVELVRAEATKRGQADPIETRDYRGVTVYKLGELRYCRVGSWFISSNKDELGRAILDRHFDGELSTLAGVAEHNKARELATGSGSTTSSAAAAPAAWAYVRLDMLRMFGIAKPLAAKHRNPGVELLAGGAISSIDKTPFLTASLFADNRDLRLVVAAPHDPKWVPETRKFYFGDKAGAPKPLEVPGGLLSLSTHRDLSALWLAASDLFDENVTAEMAKADSNLGLFFAGHDFGREILGGLAPQMQLVVARPTFDGTGPTPAIKVPAFALVLQLKEPAEKMRTQLKVAFQSTLGFLNIVGAQQGNPQMELKSEEKGANSILSAVYVLDEDKEKQTDAKIQFNFSPSMTLVGNRVVISSTRQLAGQLLDAAVKTPIGERVPENTLLEIDAQVGKQMLADNVKQLVAQNMLEKGHSEAEAQKEINGLIELMGWLKGAGVKLTEENKALKLEFGIKLAE